MKTTLICWILLAIASTAAAQLGELERTLNLQGFQPLFARASGKLLLLTVTNQPPELFSLLKPDPRPPKNRNPSLRERKVQVLFGRDVLGFAAISEIGRNSIQRGGTNAPKTVITSLSLMFETDEQAAKSAAALRLPDVEPKPIQRRKGAK